MNILNPLLCETKLENGSSTFAALSRVSDQHEQFACFAFRSTEQAETKAAEFRRSGQYRKAHGSEEFLGLLPPGMRSQGRRTTPAARLR